MTGKDLLEGLSYIDDGFVAEAENETMNKAMVLPWVRMAAMAACFCLITYAFAFWRSYEPVQIPLYCETQESTVMSEPTLATDWENGKANAPSLPKGPPTADVPSVVLRVMRMTENGFVGTVAELVGTNILEIGMELNVVYAEDTKIEISMASDSEYKSERADHTGTYVVVQFINYNRETNTLTINLMEPKG